MADPSSASNGVRIVATCDDCGNEYDGKTVRMIEAFTRARVPRYCPDCTAMRLRMEEVQREEAKAKQLAYWRAEWLRLSGIPPKYQPKSFDGPLCPENWAASLGYDATGNEARIQLIREWADGFPVDGPPVGYPSLLIAARNNGVGKTHLACAALKAIIGRFEALGFERPPFRFHVANDLKFRLQDAQRFSSTEKVGDVYQELRSLRLLVLDDMGKEKAIGADAAHVYEMYYTIINERYNNGLPMLITSNLGMEPWAKGGPSLEDIIGLAGVSRLKEMTGGKELVIEGEDRR